jgi:hypothetical protein
MTIVAEQNIAANANALVRIGDRGGVGGFSDTVDTESTEKTGLRNMGVLLGLWFGRGGGFYALHHRFVFVIG